MLPKPESRILPTQDEFDSWTLHPVTQFVAASYAAQAKQCEGGWIDLFSHELDPIKLDTKRRELFIKRECFRAFMESHYLDHLRSVDPEAWARVDKSPAKILPATRRRA